MFWGQIIISTLKHYSCDQNLYLMCYVYFISKGGSRLDPNWTSIMKMQHLASLFLSPWYPCLPFIQKISLTLMEWSGWPYRVIIKGSFPSPINNNHDSHCCSGVACEGEFQIWVECHYHLHKTLIIWNLPSHHKFPKEYDITDHISRVPLTS